MEELVRHPPEEHGVPAHRIEEVAVVVGDVPRQPSAAVADDAIGGHGTDDDHPHVSILAELVICTVSRPIRVVPREKGMRVAGATLEWRHRCRRAPRQKVGGPMRTGRGKAPRACARGHPDTPSGTLRRRPIHDGAACGGNETAVGARGGRGSGWRSRTCPPRRYAAGVGQGTA